MERELAPLALFVYNRPYHTRLTVESLQRNVLAGQTNLYVYSDAAKSGNESRVEEVRNYIKGIKGFKSLTIIEREENYGLAKSIIAGVTDLTERYGKVIVFEDDLVSSPYTLQYFNEALNKYASQEKVMHISAYMYPLKNPEELEDTFFYRVAHSWGWATWKRAWDNFNPDIDDLIQQFDEHKIYQFSIERKMNFWNQVQEFKTGKNNSWAIRWYASMFLKDGLSLNPS
ncbi:glycosyltransferase, partial [Pseudoxanthomonas sp. SGD-10]